jgi:hypothetical protein
MTAGHTYSFSQPDRPELFKELVPSRIRERERGAFEVPRKIFLWRFKKRPARRLRNPVRPLFLPFAAWSPWGRRTKGHAAVQHPATGSRPWVDPSGLRRAFPVRQVEHGAARPSAKAFRLRQTCPPIALRRSANCSRKVPVRSPVLHEQRCEECKGGFWSGDKYFFRSHRGHRKLPETLEKRSIPLRQVVTRAGYHTLS